MPFAQYYLFVVLALIPAIRIFERAGFRPWWALLLAAPDVGFILCAAALALRKWPQKARV
jgi:hypothetical protein